MAYTTFRGNAALNILSAKHEANISSIKCVRFCIFHWSPSPGRSLLNVASWLSMLFWWCWPCTTLHDFIVVYYEFGKFRVEFSSVFIIFMVIVPSFLHLFLSLSLSLSLSFSHSLGLSSTVCVYERLWRSYTITPTLNSSIKPTLLNTRSRVWFVFVLESDYGCEFCFALFFQLWRLYPIMSINDQCFSQMSRKKRIDKSIEHINKSIFDSILNQCIFYWTVCVCVFVSFSNCRHIPIW